MHIPQLYIKRWHFISKYDTLPDTLETFVMCISEFYLRANVTKYIGTQMSLFYCTPVNCWNEGFYCASDMHISLGNIST